MSESTRTAPAPKGTGTLTTIDGARHARIWGVGGYRPDRVVPNSELVDRIDSSDQWIRERSGIISRFRAAPEESIIDMAEHAARDAITAAGLEPSQVGAIIVSTVTHLLTTPAAAPMLAERLGVQCPAFDVSAACAGYCYGVSLANDMVRGGSAFIFGDGAGAAVVGPSDTPGIGPTIWGSDGAQWEAIRQREPWLDASGTPLDSRAVLTMAGQTVFRWAVWGMAPVAQQAIDKAGITIDDLDAFLPHQANMRIIDAMIKQLKLPADIPVARDIAETANTSAASIPLATERMLREGEAPHGGLALQIGFGAGLVYAAQVVVLP
ncbi:MAG: beta-ketoacyl-ACP synthase III [Lapillicoccus sp.]